MAELPAQLGTIHPDDTRVLALQEELGFLSDTELLGNIAKTHQALQEAAERGVDHWIVAFSGGKDSSLVVTLILEFLKRQQIDGVVVDVVYSDTLLELPPFEQNALHLLEHIDVISSRFALPVRTHKVVAPVEQRYWFLVLGKGYPPPHNHFRWCTDRLKIRPTRAAMAELAGVNSAVLTGVRFNESDNRDGRLKVAAMCSKDDSECGQGVWLNGDGEMGILGLAPIAHWRTCKVWDFLMIATVEWNYPFASLSRMYGDSPATRFGCWMCTLVKEDKALRSVTRHPEWASLAVLEDVRLHFTQEGRKVENRILQANGNPGRASLEFRERSLAVVLQQQAELNIPLISGEEVAAIRQYWSLEQRLGSPYNSECRTWKWRSRED